MNERPIREVPEWVLSQIELAVMITHPWDPV